jgi:hypothetical protein
VTASAAPKGDTSCPFAFTAFPVRGHFKRGVAGRDHGQTVRRVFCRASRQATQLKVLRVTVEEACPARRVGQRLTALQAWYDAEYARVHRSTEEPGLWISMRDECVESRPPWLETYAEAVLRRGRTGRTEGIRLLRAGYDLALRLAADGTRADLEELGRLAHVDLRPSEATVWADELHLQALTPRERDLSATWSKASPTPRSPRRW